jgi:hypothetical protein
LCDAMTASGHQFVAIDTKCVCVTIDYERKQL